MHYGRADAITTAAVPLVPRGHVRLVRSRLGWITAPHPPAREPELPPALRRAVLDGNANQDPTFASLFDVFIDLLLATPTNPPLKTARSQHFVEHFK
jgi:hypothetical protein